MVYPLSFSKLNDDVFTVWTVVNPAALVWIIFSYLSRFKFNLVGILLRNCCGYFFISFDII